MYKNLLKDKLYRGEPVAGCMIQGFHPALVEICGLAGFDFVFIDAEHGALSPSECEELVRAAEVRNTVPLIRVPNCQPDTILRFMDIGAMGVILPGVSTKQETERAVGAVKYYPQGCRGLNAVRASDYGMSRSLSEYVIEANKETVVIAIIENSIAIENLADILTVDGLDGAILGTTDLSQSLGVPGQGKHPRVQEAYQTFIKEGRKSGKALGTVVRPGETVKEYLDVGLSILITSAYSLFGKEAKRFVGEFK
ncbi:HpcH/HpaI aldolase family protein [Dendrosporobacter sp. 1207_IL3150]|uniref:HpcH/HpaI aldolase family protein n=1 Tax=Dendrosporobacter sp. 1207_IL3150 TaxID=3084054 RepID=UPI002FDAC37A